MEKEWGTIVRVGDEYVEIEILEGYTGPGGQYVITKCKRTGRSFKAGNSKCGYQPPEHNYKCSSEPRQ